MWWPRGREVDGDAGAVWKVGEGEKFRDGRWWGGWRADGTVGTRRFRECRGKRSETFFVCLFCFVFVIVFVNYSRAREVSSPEAGTVPEALGNSCVDLGKKEDLVDSQSTVGVELEMCRGAHSV